VSAPHKLQRRPLRRAQLLNPLMQRRALVWRGIEELHAHADLLVRINHAAPRLQHADIPLDRELDHRARARTVAVVRSRDFPAFSRGGKFATTGFSLPLLRFSFCRSAASLVSISFRRLYSRKRAKTFFLVTQSAYRHFLEESS